MIALIGKSWATIRQWRPRRPESGAEPDDALNVILRSQAMSMRGTDFVELWMERRLTDAGSATELARTCAADAGRNSV